MKHAEDKEGMIYVIYENLLKLDEEALQEIGKHKRRSDTYSDEEIAAECKRTALYQMFVIAKIKQPAKLTVEKLGKLKAENEGRHKAAIDSIITVAEGI